MSAQLGRLILGAASLGEAGGEEEQPSFTLDAIVKKTQTGSFTADAFIRHPDFTLDAVVKKTQAASFTANARLSDPFRVNPGTILTLVNNSSASNSIDVGTNPRGFIVLVAAGGNNDLQFFSTITVGGQALSYVTQATFLGRTVYLFEYLSPVTMSGSKTFQVTLSGNFGTGRAIAYALHGEVAVRRLGTSTTGGAATAFSVTMDSGAVEAFGFIAVNDDDTTSESAISGTTEDGHSGVIYFGHEADFDTGSRSFGFTGQDAAGRLGALYAEVPSDFTASAIVRKVQTGSFTADAYIVAAGQGALTLDAIVKKTQAGAFTSDAIIRKTQTASFASDAVVFSARTGSFTANAAIRRVQSGSFTADALLRRTQAASFTADAVIFRTQVGPFTADANVVGEGEATFDLDAVVRKTQAASFTADALIKRVQTGSFTADAVVFRTQTASFTASAVVFRSIAASFTTDARIAAVATTGSFVVDAYLQLGFVDDKADVRFLVDPVDVVIETDFSSFTAEADDPQYIWWWTGEGVGDYTGWLGIEITSTARLRIYTILDGNGMEDTLLGIWGPSETPPGEFDEPWNLSDDGFSSGRLSSLHDFGEHPLGSSYPDGSLSSTDTQNTGVPLTPGKYWVAVWPYDDDLWDTSEGPVRLAIERFYGGQTTLDAVIKKTYDGITRPETPSFVAAGTPTSNWESSTISGNRPSGTQDGDLLIAFVAVHESGSSKTITSSGWSLYQHVAGNAHNQCLHILTKTASSEPSSWTFTASVEPGAMSIGVIAIRDGVLLDSITVSDVGPISTAATGDLATPGRAIAVAAFSQNIFGPTVTWSLDGDLTEVVDTSAYFSGLAVGYEVVTDHEVVQYQATPSASIGYDVNALLSFAGAAYTGILVDAVISPRPIYGFTADAVLLATVVRSSTADAVIISPEVGDIAVDALVTEWYVRKASATIDSLVVISATSFSLSAVVADDTFPVVRWLTANAVIKRSRQGSFTADAYVMQMRIVLDAQITTGRVTRQASFLARSWLELDEQVRTGFTFTDAWIDSWWSLTPFTVDAEIIGTLRTGSFTVAADRIGVGEVRGTFAIDSTFFRRQARALSLEAEIAEQEPFSLDAWLAGAILVDAAVRSVRSASFVAAARLATKFTADALVVAPVSAYFGLYGLVASLDGDIRLATLDAVVEGSAGPFDIEVLAIIRGAFGSFGAGAFLSRAFTVDAFIRGFAVNAYIESAKSVIYPPSQEGSADTSGSSQSGSDGSAVDPTTFTSPTADFTGLEGAVILIDGVAHTIVSVTSPTTVVVTGTVTGTGLDWSIPTLSDPDASFDDSLVGSTIVIEGIEYTIIAVVDEHTVIVGGVDEWVYANGGVGWFLPSGSPTDPLGDDPPVGRKFRVVIEWSRPGRYPSWTEITGDVIWARAEFTQTARIGAGTFTLPLKGAFSQFVGGEDIRLTVDDIVVFGGFVQEVERGYVFEDDYLHPVTTLHGTDYNVVLDRRLVYNENWDIEQGGSGKYRNIKSFAVGTSDQEIIRTIVQRYMTAPWMDGFDFQSFVDEIETPAPFDRWATETGTQLRQVLTEISRITEGVWYVDAHKKLHYHDRGIVSAPYPVTDGDGGIACRGLRIRSRVDVMANDVFVWGTEAYVDGPNAEIIYRRETADATWEADYWAYRVERTQEQISEITSTPAGQRTVKQQTRLAAARKRLTVESGKLAGAGTSAPSVESYGRWQHAEFRQDLLKQWAVDRRALAIMNRYSQPVVSAEATVFDPGFGAGQVVEVVSSRHGVAVELVIRQMTIDFAVSKEPDGDEYYALPRYHLSMGLDPEEPWDTYQFLPFPDLPGIPGIDLHMRDIDIGQYNPTIISLPEEPSDTAFYVTGSIHEEWSPFDGLVPGNPTGISSYVSRIYPNGDRSTWLAWPDDDTEWSDGRFIQADEQGVYVLVSTDASVYIVAYSPDGDLRWSTDVSIDAFSFGLKDGVITIDAATTMAAAIDASDGHFIWQYAGGYGFNEGGAIRGPDVDGPTLWSTDFYSGVNHLALIGSSGIIGEWTLPVNVDTQTLMPTSDPTVFYAWDSVGGQMLWRIDADGASPPTVTQMGLTFHADDSIGASMDPVTQRIFAHRPYAWAPADPFEVRAYDVYGTELWGPVEIDGAEDFASIFGNSRAHDGLYMQVAYAQGDPVGASVTVFDQTTGAIVFGPYVFGDNESAGWLNGAFYHVGDLLTGVEYLDDFERDYSDDADFGLATSERAENRPWSGVSNGNAFSVSGGVGRLTPPVANGNVMAQGPSGLAEMPVTSLPVRSDSALITPAAYQGASYVPLTENTISLTSPTVLSTSEMTFVFRMPVIAGIPAAVQRHDYSVATDRSTFLSPGQAATGWYASTETAEMHADVGGTWWRLTSTGWGRARFENGSGEGIVELTDGQWLTVVMSFGDVVRSSLYSGGTLLASLTVTPDTPPLPGEDPAIGDTVTIGGSLAMASGTPALEWGEIALAYEANPYPDPGEADVEPGWNTEVTPVTDGKFILSATPTPGSVEVFDSEGELLTYLTEWGEADDLAVEYWVTSATPYVSVTYFVDTPELNQHAPVARASERQQSQNQSRGPQTGLY